MGSTAVMNVMFGWLKGVANWILGLFNLAGSGGFSPLAWLSENWLQLLIVLLVAGVVIDVIVWLLRWRPHWVWFNKKRIVINDDNFFAGEDLVDSGLYDPTLFADEASPQRASPPPRRPRSRTMAASRRPQPQRRRRDMGAAGDDIFDVSRASSMSGGEDEVFNVSDLPVSSDELAFRDIQKRRR